MSQAECFVSGPLARILRITRFFCLAPLWFAQEKQGWRIGYSPWRYFVGSIFMTIINVSVIWTMIIEPPLGFDTITVMQRLVYVVKVLVVMLTTDFMTIGSSRLVRCIITSCRRLKEINATLNIHQWSYQNNNKLLGLSIAWILLNVFVYAMDFVKKITNIEYSARNVLTKTSVWVRYFCFIILQMASVQFMVFVFHIKGTFKAVNDGLRQLLQDPNVNDVSKEMTLFEKYRAYEFKYNREVKTIIDPWTKHENIDTDNYIVPHEAVRRICMAYVSACGVVQGVNRSYGLMLLMYLAVIFLCLITTPYDFIVNLMARDLINDVYETLINQFFWCIYHTSNLMIIECCHVTHVEMEATRKLVCHLMRYTHSVNDPLAVELERFCKDIELNEVFFKPLGVTTMSRGLIVTILASVITYLVILVDIK